MTEVKVTVPVAKVTTWAKIKGGDVIALDKKMYKVDDVEPCGYASIRATLIDQAGIPISVIKREKTTAMVVG